MALGSTPTLQQIKTELGSSNNDLISFIAEAGKTGVWDSQLDFANFSYYTPVIDYGTQTNTTNTLTNFDGRRLLVVDPTSSTCVVNVTFSYELTINDEGSTLSTAYLYYGVSSSPTTAPSTWTTIASRTSDGTTLGSTTVSIPANQYGFVRYALCTFGVGDQASANTLITSASLPSCGGSASVSGTLFWEQSLG